MHGESEDGPNAQCAPAFQLIRHKRPRTPDRHVETHALPASEKAPRHMALPGFAELLAAQKQRNDRDVVTELLGTLSSEPATDQGQTVTVTSATEITQEDKTPWPSAMQYFQIFATPTNELQIPVYDFGVDPRGVPLHPEFIYSQPVSCMYFLKCARLLGRGSFGFPRKLKLLKETTPSLGGQPRGKAESSKDFEWRKMSFVTGLPKKRPMVRYITATCYSRATRVCAKKKVFRMHAVMLADESGTGEQGEYVLVHLRAGGSKRVGLRARLAGMEVPVTPTSVPASSYSSFPASTSPRMRKLLHAEFSASKDEDSRLVVSTVSVVAASKTRHAHRNATEELHVDSARLALRNLVLNSCSSRDEMVKYVMGLQEELAALQEPGQGA